MRLGRLLSLLLLLGLPAQAERLLIDAQAILPVYHPVTHLLVAPQVKGWIANPADSHRAQYLSLVP